MVIIFFGIFLSVGNESCKESVSALNNPPQSKAAFFNESVLAESITVVLAESWLWSDE